jgi:hypothetical protein
VQRLPPLQEQQQRHPLALPQPAVLLLLLPPQWEQLTALLLLLLPKVLPIHHAEGL